MLKLKFLFFLLFLLGCAATAGVGSQRWYDSRMKDIDESYKKGEITRAQSLELKTEADRIRAQTYCGTNMQTQEGYDKTKNPLP